MTKRINTEDFDRILADLIEEESSSGLLGIPGVYEALSEYFNNEVLDRWNIECADAQQEG